ncbi:MAG: hypothetical protein ACYCZQ_03180 [Burkholderiales bacterium]
MSNYHLPIKYTKGFGYSDNVALPQETVWGDFVDTLSHFKITPPEDKSKVVSFIPVRMVKATRLLENAREMYMLVLDYDESSTISQAIEQFKQYEFVLYSSYNHQHQKGGKPACDRFRIVFPLLKPIKKNVWKSTQDSSQGIAYHLLSFAQGVDPACLTFSQLYTLPCHRPGDTPVFIHNEGDLLDISGWPSIRDPRKVDIVATTPLPTSTVVPDKKTLPPDTVFRTQQGNILFGDVNKYIGHVYCPIHHDNSPGEFINVKGDSAWFVCHKCGTFHRSKPITFVETFSQQTKEKKRKHALEELVSLPDFVRPYDLTKRKKMLQKKFGHLKQTHNLLFTAEGFGKSSLASYWVSKHHPVILSCKSNAQAAEQASRFISEGIKVQLVVSADYRLRTEYQVTATHYAKTNPWEGERVNEKETLNSIVSEKKITMEEAKSLWASLQAPPPNQLQHQLIITTHARVAAWSRIQSSKIATLREEKLGESVHTTLPSLMRALQKSGELYIKPNTIVMFDDPSYSDFQQLYPYVERWDKGKFAIREIQGRKYFIRPDEYKMGYGLTKCKIVFTTTEIITSELIKKNYPSIYAPDDLIPDERLFAGRVEVYKTKLVREKYDGMLSVLHHRALRTSEYVVYIGDGSGNRINLVNNKGQNSLSAQDTIIKISKPHLSKIILLCDELGWSQSDQNAVGTIIALDAAHQAIGRNSGYRWYDQQREDPPTCIVLIDPSMYQNFLLNTRYYINAIGNLDIDSRPSPPSDSTWDTQFLYWARNLIKYMGTQQYLLHDTQAAIAESGLLNRLARVRRILKSLRHILDTEKMTDETREKIISVMQVIEQKLPPPHH